MQGMVRSILVPSCIIQLCTFSSTFLYSIVLIYTFFLQVQLNLMAPTRDNYYGNQQTIQGLVHHILLPQLIK
jgi:hypothetical protein